MTIANSRELSQIYEWSSSNTKGTLWQGTFKKILQTASSTDVLPLVVTARKSGTTLTRRLDLLAVAGIPKPTTTNVAMATASEEADMNHVEMVFESSIKQLTDVQIQTRTQ